MAAALDLDPTELPRQRTPTDDVADRLTERLMRALEPFVAAHVRAALQEEGEPLEAA